MTSKPTKKQKPQDVSEVTLSRCKKCDSTEREAYFGTPIVHDIAGIHNGREYNRKVMKRTRCKACGQQRLDAFFELQK